MDSPHSPFWPWRRVSFAKALSGLYFQSLPQATLLVAVIQTSDFGDLLHLSGTPTPASLSAPAHLTAWNQ
jgi:hypothetical protein